MRAKTPKMPFGSAPYGLVDHFGWIGEPGPPGAGITGVRPTFGAGFAMLGSISAGGQTMPRDCES
jgi:hypothetical protein